MLHTLERDGQPAVVFEGVALGVATTHRTGKLRWTEIHIYRTKAGAFIVEVLGCSEQAHERTLRTVRIAQTAAEAIDALRNHEGKLSRPAYAALDESAEADRDEALADALDEYDKESGSEIWVD